MRPLRAARSSVAVALLLVGPAACSDNRAPGAQSVTGASWPPVGSEFEGARVGRASPAGRRTLIGKLIQEHGVELGVTASRERAELLGLYGAEGCAPLWLDAAGRPAGQARDALRVLGGASDEGLDRGDYFEGLLDRLAGQSETASLAPIDMARFDLALSAGLLRYLRHVHMGRVDPRAIGFRLEAPRDRHDFPALLCSAIADDRVAAMAAELQPPLTQYRDLRTALRRYRMLANDSTLVRPPLSATAVRPGEPYSGLNELRRVLLALGDLQTDAPDAKPGRYEGALVEAVRRFQVRHGLEPDGVLGKETVARLRVPPSWRVRQIELALERLRWLPHFGAERLIVLNIPMFRLWAWDMTTPNEAPLFGMDAIVGRALHTQTPVFVEEMREVIFRPYWNVPRSILRNEVLPTLERDPDYLRREDMEIVRGQGDHVPRVELTTESLTQLRQGALRVRQRPGPKNALGLVKFVFPNKEDVYMHGTPAQALFARSRRDFSHGCVRVADPVALAQWVLQDWPQWTRDRILVAMAGKTTIRVPLPTRVRVVLFYATAAVTPEDGAVRFADDIYRHDARLDRAFLNVARLDRAFIDDTRLGK